MDLNRLKSAFFNVLKPKTVALLVIFWALLFVIGYSTNPLVGFVCVIITVWALFYARIFALSLFLSVSLSFGTYFLIIILIYLFGSLLDLDITRVIIVFSHVVIVCILITVCVLKKSRHLQPVRVNKADVFSIIAFLVILIFLIAPIITKNYLQQLKYLSIGEDNISHFEIYNSINKNRGLLYSRHNDNISTSQGLSTYPQGMHANLVANSVLVYGNDSTLSELIKSFTAQISIYYALFSAMIIYIITSSFFYLTTGDKRIPLIGNLLMLSITLLVLYFGSLGTLLYLFIFGFQTQIVSYIFILLTVVVFLDFSRSAFTSRTKWLSVATLCLSAIAIANVWFFLMPVMAGLGLAYAYLEKEFMIRHYKPLTIVIVGTIATAMYPVLINIRSSGSASHILEAGGVYKITSGELSVIAFIGLGFALSQLLMWTEKGRSTIKLSYPVSVSLISSLLFSAMLFIYMYVKVGHLSYYFYKSVYTLVIFALISLGYSVGALFRYLSRCTNANYVNGIAMPLFILTLILWIFLKPSTFPLEYMHDDIQTGLDMNYINMLDADKYTRDLIFRSPCIDSRLYITQRWIGALLLNGSSARSELSSSCIPI